MRRRVTILALVLLALALVAVAVPLAGPVWWWVMTKEIPQNITDEQGRKLIGWQRVKRWGAPVGHGKWVLFYADTGYMASDWLFSADHPVGIIEGTSSEAPFSNLVDSEKESERFTFVFDGNSQVLDHMLVSPALFDRFRAADILHFNAGFPAELNDDESTALRASDHDPLEGRFRFK